jgi:hypothetical protein
VLLFAVTLIGFIRLRQCTANIGAPPPQRPGGFTCIFYIPGLALQF